MLKRLTTQSPCPYCKKMLSRFSHPNAHVTPSPGTTSVCIHCGEFLEFDGNLELIGISTKTLINIPAEDLRRAKRVINEFNALRRNNGKISDIKNP